MNFANYAELYPILNFDPDPGAIINPPQGNTIPATVVLCFFKEVVEKVAAAYKAEIVNTFRSEGGLYPVYEIEFKGEKIAFFQPGIGSALGAGLLDQAIGSGARNIIACGGCGVLDKNVACGHVLLPTAAYREEGTSYHYLPPSSTVEIEPTVINLMETVLFENRIEYLKTKSWTTDGFYRETLGKAAYYKSQGVLAVEMEMSALAAVAKFRNVKFGQYLYAGDMVVPEGWDKRGWVDRTDVREVLFWLSVEACLRIEKEL
ncbi:MAG: nucleoside phosphorylase [Anaerolineaceae bacterium]